MNHPCEDEDDKASGMGLLLTRRVDRDSVAGLLAWKVSDIFDHGLIASAGGLFEWVVLYPS